MDNQEQSDTTRLERIEKEVKTYDYLTSEGEDVQWLCSQIREMEKEALLRSVLISNARLDAEIWKGFADQLPKAIEENTLLTKRVRELEANRPVPRHVTLAHPISDAEKESAP